MKDGNFSGAIALVALIGAGIWAINSFEITKRQGQDDRICATPPSVMQGDWRGCLHRWSYRFASAPGSNQAIARAVLAGCDEANEWSVKLSPEADRAEVRAYIKETSPNLALFHVTQARAGHCDIP